MEHFPTAFARIHVPMLVIRPGEDEVARFETMASIIAQHPHQDLIDVSSFDGLHHNPLSEGQDSMEHVTNEMLAWIKSHHSIGVLR